MNQKIKKELQVIAGMIITGILAYIGYLGLVFVFG